MSSKYISISYSCGALIDIEQICAEHNFKWEDVVSLHCKWAVLTIILKDDTVIEVMIDHLIGDIDYREPRKIVELDEDYEEVLNETHTSI